MHLIIKSYIFSQKVYQRGIFIKDTDTKKSPEGHCSNGSLIFRYLLKKSKTLVFRKEEKINQQFMLLLFITW